MLAVVFESRRLPRSEAAGATHGVRNGEAPRGASSCAPSIDRVDPGERRGVPEKIRFPRRLSIARGSRRNPRGPPQGKSHRRFLRHLPCCDRPGQLFPAGTLRLDEADEGSSVLLLEQVTDAFARKLLECGLGFTGGKRRRQPNAPFDSTVQRLASAYRNNRAGHAQSSHH